MWKYVNYITNWGWAKSAAIFIEQFFPYIEFLAGLACFWLT